MATTLSSLQTKLNNLADETVDATKATSWINDVYKDVASRSDWSWLQDSSNFSTVVGDNNYSVAANCMEIFQMRTKDRQLTPQSRQWLFEKHPEYPEYTDEGTVYTATPTDFVHFGGEVLLYPIPDAIESVYYMYKKTVSDLSSGTDEPLIPEEFREVLALGAYLKWTIADEADKYIIDNAKAEFEQKVQNMIFADNTRKNVNSTIPYSRREI
jgi:hypothetical protein